MYKPFLRPERIHSRHEMHPNSILAFDYLKELEAVKTIKERILILIRYRPLCRPDIAQLLGKEVNCVCHPVKTLLDNGTITRSYTAKNPRTGRMVDYLIMAEEKKEPQMRLF